MLVSLVRLKTMLCMTRANWKISIAFSTFKSFDQPFGEKGRGNFNLIKYKINNNFLKREKTTSIPLEIPIFSSAPLFSQWIGSENVGSCSFDWAFFPPPASPDSFSVFWTEKRAEIWMLSLVWSWRSKEEREH